MHKTRLALLIMLAGTLAACGESSTLQVSDGTGPQPRLPAPNKTLIPTVNIAPAIGWPAGATPHRGARHAGGRVRRGPGPPALAAMCCPTAMCWWPKPMRRPSPKTRKGIKGWVMDMVMERAGAGVPSANRITLLRDTDGDGVAETAHGVAGRPELAVRHGAGRQRSVRRQLRRVLRFPYQPGDTRIKAPGAKVVDLPGGPINHHWTKNLIASTDGSKLYVTVGSNSNVGETRHGGRSRSAPRSGKSTAPAASTASSPPACATPTAWPGSRSSGALWTVVNERDEIGSDLVPDYLTSVQATAASTAGPTATTASTSTRASSRRTPTWWPRRLRPTTRWARTPLRWAWRSPSGTTLPARVRQRHVHRPAWLVEPQAAQRLQGDLRAVRERQADRRSRSMC